VKAPDNDGTVKNGPVAFGSFTALHLATAAGSADFVKLLLDAGATVDARDVRGLTPLTWAIASDRPQPRIVRVLLEKGSNLSSPSNEGENALDWARKYNNPAMLRELKLPVAQPAAQAELPILSVARTPREAVERSLPLLRIGSAGVMSNGGCVACHAQPMSAMAAELASHRGWRAEPPTGELTQVTASSVAATGGFLQGRESGGLPDTQLYITFTMATMNVPPSLASDAFVYYLAAKQRAAGNWHGIATRAPIQDGDINRTALAIRTLAVYGMPARRAELGGRIDRAAGWLAEQTPLSTEERVMQLLGLKWATARAALRQTRTRELIALQHSDGGWSQTPYLTSDAYATGQVLYALAELGSTSETAVQKGVAFLLRTQATDGSWHVKSRAMKIQPYFQSGFPYDHDQWISQSGTAWATMALALTTRPEPTAVSTLTALAGRKN